MLLRLGHQWFKETAQPSSPARALKRIGTQSALAHSQNQALRRLEMSPSSPEMGIDAANHELNTIGLKKYLDSETRRNIVIENMTPEALNQLLGKEFYLGAVRLKATELCIPCERPAKLASKMNFLAAFENKGGIRAQVLESGDIRVGDTLKTALLA